MTGGGGGGGCYAINGDCDYIDGDYINGVGLKMVAI